MELGDFLGDGLACNAKGVVFEGMDAIFFPSILLLTYAFI